MITETKPIQILIIDDYPIIVSGLHNTLNTLLSDPKIQKAGTKDEAFQKLKNEHFDLAFLDVNLNGVNMMEHLDEINTIRKNTKIIVFTAYTSDKIKALALAKNVDGFLDKNTSIEELEFAIKEVLSGNAYINQKEDLSFSMEDSPDKFEKINSLTKRERDVVNLIVKGNTNETIAKKLFLSFQTVQSHRKNIYRKLDIHSATELIYLHLRYMTHRE